MTSRTCRPYFSRWTKMRNAKTFREREHPKKEREREKEKETKTRKRQMQANEENGGNEKRMGNKRRYGASASCVVHTLH